MRVLLSGASGFVGSHVLRHLLTNTDAEVVCPVTFHHKGLPARIVSAVDNRSWQDRVKIVHWDMRSTADYLTRFRIGEIDVFMNIASESHVNRSISDPVPFVENNVSLMLRALELARVLGPKLFLQMSTDEVYGPAHDGERHPEWAPVIPSNPYSASKAAQEALAVSYWRTYGVPVVLTNTMNIIGEMQDAEKFVPLIIRCLMNRTPIPVHISPDGTPGSRFYLHARNLADAWLWLTERYLTPVGVGTLAEPGRTVVPGPPQYADGAGRPDRFNIVGEQEISNAELVRAVGQIMELPPDVYDGLIEPVSFHASRPGHDLRYALDGTRLGEQGWRAPVPFWESLHTTVRWYLAHPEWLSL